MLRTALAYLGTPYRWGGDDPSGYDCSGFVLECLKSAGLIEPSVDLTADDLWQRYRSFEIDFPRCGALMFVMSRDAPTRAYHVTICLDRWHQIGAAGGGEDTRDNADAWKHNAWVKIRPIKENATGCRFCDPFAA
jgi:cell wall-associated NlpC family hydrolase